MAKLPVEIPNPTYADLKQSAHRNEMSVTAVINLLIRDYLKAEKAQLEKEKALQQTTSEPT